MGDSYGDDNAFVIFLILILLVLGFMNGGGFHTEDIPDV